MVMRPSGQHLVLTEHYAAGSEYPWGGGARQRWFGFGPEVLGTAQFLAQGHHARGIIGYTGP